MTSWTGTTRFENVVFWGGPFGLHSDVGGDLHIYLKDVFFVVHSRMVRISFRVSSERGRLSSNGRTCGTRPSSLACWSRALPFRHPDRACPLREVEIFVAKTYVLGPLRSCEICLSPGCLTALAF